MINARFDVGDEKIISADASCKISKCTWAGFDCGYNMNTSSLSTYNFGLFWFPTKGLHVGLTHESSDEENQVSEIGHLKWSIYQKPSANWKLAYVSDLNYG
jgi:hypothetical protein